MDPLWPQFAEPKMFHALCFVAENSLKTGARKLTAVQNNSLGHVAAETAEGLDDIGTVPKPEDM